MKHLLTFFTSLLLAPLVATFAADVPVAKAKLVHVIILSGQTMNGVDPKKGFESEAKARFAGAEVLYFKVAKGGAQIRLWVTEWDQIAARHGIDVKTARAGDAVPGTLYYEPILAEYRKLLEGRAAPVSVTFCWMQGEQDHKEKLDAAYADSLRQLIANLRRDLNRPDMNVVIGRLNDWGDAGNTAWQNIRRAHVAISAADPHAAWIDTDDLNDKETDGVMENKYHFTGAGCDLLGRRFARQTRLLVEGSGQAREGRPQ
ncbi:MAG: sialate O-acetylesterase [Opitutaceae bacterium]|nr:sialate O-acetylesterase [Opitutaceae bacterium]